MQKKKGISLIVLVITIIVMVILAGAIVLTLNNSGIISKASEAVFKQNVKNYQSELSLYIAEQLTANTSYDVKTLNVDNETLKDVIKSISDEDLKEFKIKEGRLVYIGTEETKKQWAKEENVEIEEVESETEPDILSQAEYEAKYAAEIATALEIGQVIDGSYSLKDEYIDKCYDGSGVSYKIALPYGVTDVNMEHACTVVDIIFPNTVKSITKLHFISAQELNLPYGLETIAGDAIEGMSLSVINIPNTVTTIGQFAFSSTAITSIKLPKSLIKLDASIVYNVKEMVIPENVVEIGDFAFMGMPIEKIYIESIEITTVGEYLFDNVETTDIVIYVRSAEIAKLFEGKYDPTMVTISTDYNWVAPEQ